MRISSDLRVVRRSGGSTTLSARHWFAGLAAQPAHAGRPPVTPGFAESRFALFGCCRSLRVWSRAPSALLRGARGGMRGRFIVSRPNALQRSGASVLASERLPESDAFRLKCLAYCLTPVTDGLSGRGLGTGGDGHQSPPDPHRCLTLVSAAYSAQPSPQPLSQSWARGHDKLDRFGYLSYPPDAEPAQSESRRASVSSWPNRNPSRGSIPAVRALGIV